MLLSSIMTICFFIAGLVFYAFVNEQLFQYIESPSLWVFVLLLMGGVIIGNIRFIAVPTLVTLLVPQDKRDRANGMSGTISGISFTITSVASGLVLANGGMLAVLTLATILNIVSIIHLIFIPIAETEIVHSEDKPKNIDIKGTIQIIKKVPGLFSLIFFSMFNNFLGGVFMSLMDAYGLNLVSVQTWGILWGFLSLGFILGGLVVAKKGLGKNPLRTMFLANIIMWTVSIFFTIQPWILLLSIGIFIWICLVPFVEAAEQTIIQKVVPHERQGRVFGFAQSVEQAASPITAFFIGPIAHYIFIPFMTTGKGVDLLGSWFGTGTDRGIALVFIFAGAIGLIVTILAMKTASYKSLSLLFK